VGDHLKETFAEVGVTSRGELVAKLFAEHHRPLLGRNVTYATF
jgi:hypothetical protein